MKGIFLGLWHVLWNMIFDKREQAYLTAELMVGYFCDLEFTLADTKMFCQFVPGSHLAWRIPLYVYSLGTESYQEILSRECIFLL